MRRLVAAVAVLALVSLAASGWFLVIEERAQTDAAEKTECYASAQMIMQYASANSAVTLASDDKVLREKFARYLQELTRLTSEEGCE